MIFPSMTMKMVYKQLGMEEQDDDWPGGGVWVADRTKSRF
jgi:hypothetical protein